MYNCAIVLAAGKGTRMKSDIPKVLHKVCGKEMINCVIDTLKASGIRDINLIVGNGADKVIENTKKKEVSYSMQEEQLGTGHAVKCAYEFLKDKKGTVLVVCGDTPLIRKEGISTLLNVHNKENNKITIVSSVVDNPTGYGRLVRNNGNVTKIVEHKDCSKEELLINEINSGMYCFDIKELLVSLEALDNNNSQGEYYLTDVVKIQGEKGHKIGSVIFDINDTIGVNSREDLEKAENILKNR